MTIKLLIKQHFDFLSLTRGCLGSSESTHVKISHCWKSHVTAQICLYGSKCKLLYNLMAEVVHNFVQ